MESELARAQALFSLDIGLKNAVQDTVDTFSKARNPSSIPWKGHTRPNEDNATSAESESRGVVFFRRVLIRCRSWSPKTPMSSSMLRTLA